MATGDWDLVIMSHTSFLALHIAPNLVDTCFQPMIEELRQYSRMLGSNEDTDGSKLVERNIALIEMRIAELKTRIQHDSERGITWERLGIDLLCVDEADAYKNLLTPTRMNRVAGLPGGNSHRAFDMKIKTWDLLKRNCRVVFATATPIANTIAEAHVMMRFLQESMLADLGVLNFDAWVQTFAAVKLVFEMKPDGSGFRFNHRLCEFRNVPELSQHIRQVWDIKMKEDLPYLKEPVMAGGKPIVVEVPASLAQRQYVQYLAECMEDIHGGRADRHKLNALLVTYWGRLCALDIRLVRPDLPADDNNKIKTLASLLSRHYHETHAQKGTQLVFCDLGVPKGKGGDNKKKTTSKPSKAREANGADRDQESSSEVETVDEIKKRNWVYHEIRRECVRLGIPIEQVAFIHEWDTPKKRPQLQRMMETGEIRILIASTQKGGAGLNIQPRLVAVYNLDAPWRPRDVEQRVGRALRQGNQWDEVYVYNIVTSGSFDAFIWQAIETKARFNHQLLRGTTQRRMMDVDAVVLSYAEVKAAASGNPKVRRQVYLSTELQRLEALRTAQANASYTMRREVSDIELQLKRIAAACASEHRAKQARDGNVEPVLRAKDEQGTHRVDDKKSAGPVCRQPSASRSAAPSTYQSVSAGG
ncbi:MAG: hypothetical protein HC853_01230 [Anaerolineae bacterium]|nr:hypothetical protein [Anaerolineae bacterium]